MGETFPMVRAAVVQAAAAVMDREACTEKACRLIAEAASQGAGLVVFPEAFIPAYPWGLRFGTHVGGRTAAGRQAWARYWANAVDVPGPVTEAIGAAARRAQAYVAIGVIERDQTYSRGTVYCTLLYFGLDGSLVAKHRKLMPTADSRDSWQATIRHIACEGRCFVLSCCQYVTKDIYPKDFELAEELTAAPDVLSRGGSAIVAPLGDYLAGPLFGQEGILVADLDLALVVQAKFDFDVTGHYARPDVFRLLVNEQSTPPVETVQWGFGAAVESPARG